MIFTKKITVYLNSDKTSADDMFEAIADTAAQYVDERVENWMVEEEQGKYERLCNCGSAECTDALEVLQ